MRPDMHTPNSEILAANETQEGEHAMKGKGRSAQRSSHDYTRNTYESLRATFGRHLFLSVSFAIGICFGDGRLVFSDTACKSIQARD